MFKVKNVDGKPKFVGFKDEDTAKWMLQFNLEYWAKMCEEHCARYDFAACPVCSDDILIWGG